MYSLLALLLEFDDGKIDVVAGKIDETFVPAGIAGIVDIETMLLVIANSSWLEDEVDVIGRADIVITEGLDTSLL